MDISQNTLTEYEICMQSAERRVFDLLNSLEWQPHSEKKNGNIWKMRCNITENNMFRYEGIIPNRTPIEVFLEDFFRSFSCLVEFLYKL
ncbi:hypothetical protein DICVIV_11472 [Dictyocaulus viviparus]|uniref:Uncharacterized protein n=1 Tax=Dictyocaulus viviparus TaxID=29172 RepID=A0A0D8XFP1_DICVI|nr:hypothetical protein DICVIV_11472 [Dictyocaulus viviparus]